MIRTDRYREATLNTNTQAVQYFSTEGGQSVNTVCVTSEYLSDYATVSVPSG